MFYAWQSKCGYMQFVPLHLCDLVSQSQSYILRMAPKGPDIPRQIYLNWETS